MRGAVLFYPPVGLESCKMNDISWTRGKLALVVAAAMSLGATGLLSIAVAYPRPVVSALGPDWQCHRIAFLTSCTRLEQLQPVADRTGKATAMRRGV
jgi:hypothetical protein